MQLSLSRYFILPLYKLFISHLMRSREVLCIFEIIYINLLLTLYRVLYCYLLLLFIILALTVEDAMNIDGYPALLLHIY